MCSSDLRWTVKTDPALAPLLEIAHDIFGNKNSVSGPPDELVFFGVRRWSDKHKECRAVRRSNRYPAPNGYLSLSDQRESELVQVESQASLHVANKDGKRVNAEVEVQSIRPKD